MGVVRKDSWKEVIGMPKNIGKGGGRKTYGTKPTKRAAPKGRKGMR